MKNPLNILHNKRFLWAIIIAIPSILVVTALLLLYSNKMDGNKTSDAEQNTQKKSVSQPGGANEASIASAVTAEEAKLDQEWALIALEKKALKEKEEKIKQNLAEIKDRYKKMEDQQKLLQQQQNELEIRDEEIQTAKQSIAAERDRLKLDWQKLEIELAKRKEAQAQQQAASQKEVSVEDKIAKAKQLRIMAKGFETMRARDAADILIKMLEKDRENVLDLLRTMDNRTRTRIISAISRERVDTAANLTKELMEIQ